MAIAKPHVILNGNGQEPGSGAMSRSGKCLGVMPWPRCLRRLRPAIESYVKISIAWNLAGYGVDLMIWGLHAISDKAATN